MRREEAFDGRNLDLRAGLISAAALLAVIGCVAVFSATAALDLEAHLPPHFLRHVVALAVGIGVATLASRVPLAVWHRLSLPLWIVSVLALVVVLVAGVSAGGARRWLAVPGLGFAFQPAELAKLATVLAVAALLSRRRQRVGVGKSQLLAVFVLAAIPAGLCLLQPDLGNAVIVFLLAGLILFAAGASFPVLIGPAILVAVGVGLYSLANPYAMRRWLGFLDPWERSSTEGFQLVQSFVAFGRGGLLGMGAGSGKQKLFYLPEAHTDFILAVIAEELGLIGVLVVLGAFLAIGITGLRIALRGRRRFPMLLAFGTTALLVVPAALNAAVVMGLVPTKGLTLPLLSYGRSSLLVACLTLGILLAAAREGSRAPEGLPGARREALP